MNSFKHPDAEFRKMGKAFFKTSTFTAIFDTMSFLFPKLVENIRLSRIPAKVTKFFQNVVKETMEYRETNNVRKNDFLQLLIDMKNSADSGSRLSMPEIAAQVFVFFLAGFETSSTTATYTLLELAKNPQLRDKLVTNIDRVLEENGGEITYDILANMAYLTQVIEGSRFRLMQVKVALVTILRTYHIELSDKTDVNPKFDSKSFILQSENGMPLKATCRRKGEV